MLSIVCSECHKLALYAELFIVMLNVVMLSSVMLKAVMLNTVMLSVMGL